MARTKISGLDAIAKAFEQLPGKLAKKVIRQSLRAGANTIKADAKADAPVDTGAGRKTVRVRTSKGPRGSVKKNTIAFGVLVGQAKGPAWYMALQEAGWETPSGRKVPGRHFMRRAMRSKEKSVQQQIAVDILEGIEREAKA
jgi:HK97 gp10 family phage protein